MEGSGRPIASGASTELNVKVDDREHNRIIEVS